MKRFILCVLMLTMTVFAQEQTLLNKDVKHGVFLTSELKGGNTGDQATFYTGSRLVWVINHQYAIGLTDYHLVNKLEISEDNGILPDYVDFEYSGLDFEYISNPQSLLHFVGRLFVGGGTLYYRGEEIPKYGHDFTLVVEPTIELNMNVCKHFQLGGSASYRKVMGVEFAGLDDEDLGGFSAGITARFGWF